MTKNTPRGLIGGCASLVMFAALCGTLNAEPLKLFGLFTDHAILQQDTSVPIWGIATPGDAVSVSFRGVTASAKADADGNWLVRIKTPKAGPETDGTELVVRTEKEAVTLHDVVVGEVWLGTGQSNMDTAMRKYPVGLAELPHADYPGIRLYRGGGWSHRGDFSTYSWNRCSAESAKHASATGYFFCKELHKALNVPVGFINMAFSGSPMAPFVKGEWLQSDPRTADQYNQWLSAHKENVAKRQNLLEAWERAVEAAKAEDKEELPERPFRGPAVKPGNQTDVRYVTHIEPLMPFAFRGILWDQGEAGVGIGVEPYDVVFEVMIKGWRTGFHQELPVIYCQMPKGGSWGPHACLYGEKTRKPWYLKDREIVPNEPIPLADLPAAPPRKCGRHLFDGFAKEPDPFARMMAQEKTWMAVTRDLGIAVHPPDKDRYAHRFYLTAMNRVYGKDGVEWFGPMIESATFDGDKIRVMYTHTGSGLVALDGKPLQGFALHGQVDGTPRKAWADRCEIDGNAVLLGAADGVAWVEKVSYSSDNGCGVLWANLFNKEGLPAYPMTVRVEQ